MSKMLSGTPSKISCRALHHTRWAVIGLVPMTDGANRNDVKLLDPTLDAIEALGLLADVDTIHLDRGYDHNSIRARMVERDLPDVDIQPAANPATGNAKSSYRSGCSGSSRPPTRGSPTSASSAAAPNDEPTTATLRTASQPPSRSR